MVKNAKKNNGKRCETSWLTYYWKKSDYYLFFILYPWNWHIFRMRFLRIGHCARLHTHALLTVQCVQYCYACRCAQNQFPQIMHMKLRWSEWWNICEIYYMLLRHFVSNIWEIKNIFLFFWYEDLNFDQQDWKGIQSWRLHIVTLQIYGSLKTAKWLLDPCLRTFLQLSIGLSIELSIGLPIGMPEYCLITAQ